MATLAQFLPGLSDVAGLAAVFAVAAALILVGGVLTGGRGAPEVNLMVGWGGAAMLFTLWGVASPISMRWLASLVLVVAAAGLGFARLRPRRADLVALGRVLVLAAPLVLVLAGKQASQVDTFTHWLANAVYLMGHDMFPGTTRPAGLAAGA